MASVAGQLRGRSAWDPNMTLARLANGNGNAVIATRLPPLWRTIPSRVNGSSSIEWLVVDLEEIRHLRHPPLLDEAHMIRVLVVILVSLAVGELH